jgi:hypothetical protein
MGMKIFIKLLLLLNFASIYCQNDNNKFGINKIENIIKEFIYTLEKSEYLNEKRESLIEISNNNGSISWNGDINNIKLTILSRSRNIFSQKHKLYLIDLFKSYLSNNNLKVDYIENDNYRQFSYRQLFLLSDGKSSVRFIYESNQIDKSDWDEKIHILSYDNEILISDKDNYEIFFDKVIDYIKNSKTKFISDSKLFKFSCPNDKESNFQFRNKTYKCALVFYCQYGNQSTHNGSECYEYLSGEFTGYLGTHNYIVNQIADESLPGWQKVFYEVKKNKIKFLFLFESESSNSMGYSKIKIFHF